MSEQSTTQPRIVAAEHRVASPAPGRRQLEVLWRFENGSGVTLYVLIDQPLTTRVADPLVLDHSASEPQLPVEANRRADFEIIAVPAGGVAERRMRYHLSLPAAFGEARVVGRFGYSHAPPDGGWEAAQNRRKVAQWQSLADSEPFVAAFGS
ncbi:MAG TPA: hypothetical protein VF508_02960 [Pyrinomonadaceae bacterium]|jgi:hypothetical protein